MGLSSASVRLLVFFLAFSVIFPVAGYAFTSFGGVPSIGGISEESLMNAGIIMNDAVTHNVTRGAGWVTFDLNSTSYRVSWSADDFSFQVPHQYLGWVWPATITPTPYKGVWAIGNYSTTYNWTHFVLDEGGGHEAEAFFTIYDDYSSMYECMANGNVTVTIGRAFEPSAPDLFSFVGWYLGVITGLQTFGLPAVFLWILRMFTIIGILSAVLLAREFIPGLP
jgi:hypothetical protein